MFAKVREDSRFNIVTACAGINFSKRDWIAVPPEREKEAESNPYLITIDAMPEGDLVVAESPTTNEVESAVSPSDAPTADSPQEDQPEDQPPTESEESKPTPKRRTTRKKTP